jgi:hypothetical protein
MKFSKSQLWPTAKHLRGTNISWVSSNMKSDLSIDKDAKIISLGSCFAREIKFWLIDNGFNYLLGEQNKKPWSSMSIFKGDQGRLPTEHASIAWERVYNTFSFKHIVDYTFNDSMIKDRLIDVDISGKKYVSDIIRSRIIYPDRKAAEADVLDHISESKKMFEEADLVIFTLGLTEIWQSEKTGIVAAANPFKHYSLPEDFKFRVSRYQENLDNLKSSYEVLKKHNKSLKFLVTVSPVHLLATYRDDLDVISASCNSKSTLRAVADEFKAVDGVSYFPSYEIASLASALDGVNAFPDGHHVDRSVVDKIMSVFNDNCVKK